MLKIYYADGQTDKEKFIFDHVDPERQTILIVPDQFSLQAEQDALRICGRALLNLMVTDFSALGHKVVKETEGHEPQIIDKYGRHMLLSVLIQRLDEHLVVFGRRAGRGTSALADQMNTMISELKRYDHGPEDLENAIEQLRQGGGDPQRTAGSYLIMKLEDMLQIYRAYEEAIGGLYRDAEDYITYYADRIPRSALVRGSDVWIYGFDTFTPKNLGVIRRLLETAQNVSVVLTYEAPGDSGDVPVPAAAAAVRSLTQGGGAGLFRLTQQVMQRLEQTAEEAGREHRRERIEGYERRSIWTAAEHAGDATANAGEDTEHAGEAAECGSDLPGGTDLPNRIRLVQNSGLYEEAESAAAFIQSLVRDKGYRYGEIAVLCNDMDSRGRQLRRTFERWDIPVFTDQKRKVLHQPVVSFLLSFLEVLTDGFGGSGAIGMIKSGLLGWSAEDEALLENYITEFRIRGSRWQKPFTWDSDTYTVEELTRLNEMRKFLVSVCTRAKDVIGRHNSAKEKVRGLVRFLQEELQILERIEQAVQRQQELQLMEGAAETAQIWNAICSIFDQIVQVIGDERISNAMLRDMIEAGLQTLEIGLVPSSRDCVLMGTLQRSRPGRIRALVVTGANAGLLPLDMTEEGLLSRREKQQLEAMDLEFAGREKVTQMEEQLAIYRMFSLPEDCLYVSCSQSADDGSMLRPSEIFRRLQQFQPEVDGDLSDREFTESIGSRRATVPYLTEALRSIGVDRAKPSETGGTSSGNGVALSGNQADPWMRVLQWYEENDPQMAARLLRGARFSNRLEALGDEMADALYRGDRRALEVSASRLEKYSGCPFSHFVQYGLRAREQRLFEVGGREIGDIYHRCMMEFSRELEAATQAAEAVPTWQSITEEECRLKVKRILEGSAESYREGLFSSDGSSEFRMERIRSICGDIAWAMVCQVRQGRIRHMYFEEPFGKGTQLPAVEVDVNGRKVRIRGIIDRLDVMDTGEGQPDAIRIVDYKTGKNTIRPEDFASGYKLQLMVYMDAALQSAAAGEAGDVPSPGAAAGETGDVPSPGSDNGLQPAGVFYFKIHDVNIDGDKSAGIPDPEDPGDLQRRMEKEYRMEGIVINDRRLIGAMDDRVAGTEKAESGVIPVKYDPKKECYLPASGGSLLQREEFRALLEETNRQVERICGEICRGEIAAVPKRESKTDWEGKRVTACRYCGFQSICGFDPSIKGYRYVDV